MAGGGSRRGMIPLEYCRKNSLSWNIVQYHDDGLELRVVDVGKL